MITSGEIIGNIGVFAPGKLCALKKWVVRCANANTGCLSHLQFWAADYESADEMVHDHRWMLIHELGFVCPNCALGTSWT